MSSERPSPIPPRGINADNKAAREEEMKIEKIREIDEDAKKRRKFRMMMGDEEQVADLDGKSNAPGPYDTQFYTTSAPKPFSDLDDNSIPSPAYSPPPDVTAAPSNFSSDDDDEDFLPQSTDFWQMSDMPPDQPPQPLNFQETTQSQARTPTPDSAPKKGSQPQAAGPHSILGKEKVAAAKQKKSEPSPFGLPTKPTEKGEKTAKTSLPSQPKAAPKTPEKKPTASPSTQKKGAPLPLQSDKLEEKRGLEQKIAVSSTQKKDTKTEKVNPTSPQQQPDMIPLRAAADQEQHSGHGDKRGKEKVGEITSPSLPGLPSQVVPMAQAATTTAAPYLSPSVHSLFFQMVGTMYVMATPLGINRTEIVLNNPAFAGSKFFGSSITIEKYATAPDSFNIKLTGSDEAVVAFKDNIPNLMAAFQNGKFNFRVHRLDVEYRAERPHFRRKEREEGTDNDQSKGNRRNS